MTSTGMRATMVSILEQPMREALKEISERILSEYRVNNEERPRGIEWLAEYLNSTPGSIYTTWKAKEIPTHKYGIKLMWYKSEIDTWLKNRNHES